LSTKKQSQIVVKYFERWRVVADVDR